MPFKVEIRGKDIHFFNICLYLIIIIKQNNKKVQSQHFSIFCSTRCQIEFFYVCLFNFNFKNRGG